MREGSPEIRSRLQRSMKAGVKAVLLYGAYSREGNHYLSAHRQNRLSFTGALAALHSVAGERAMHRILPQQYLAAWEWHGGQVGFALSGSMT